MNLSSMKAAAMAATEWSDIVGEYAWFNGPELVAVGTRNGARCISEADAAHIAAFNPQVALALLAVVEAAEVHMAALKATCSDEEETALALNDALNALESLP